MSINTYGRQLGTADYMIRTYGAPAILRRASGDRTCWAFVSQYSPAEQRHLMNQITSKALVSAVGLDPPPDSEEDRLVLLDPATGTEMETRKIVAPTGELAPAGTVIYYELQLKNV
jgi:hypothetical protein